MQLINGMNAPTQGSLVVPGWRCISTTQPEQEHPPRRSRLLELTCPRTCSRSTAWISTARPSSKQLKRDQMASFFANTPTCLVGMEACGGAHHWVRKLQGFGHTVQLIAPQFAKPYVKTNKNDAADAEAICKAVPDPTCALCLSKTSSNKRFCRCTGYARALSTRVLRRPTRFVACWPLNC